MPRFLMLKHILGRGLSFDWILAALLFIVPLLNGFGLRAELWHALGFCMGAFALLAISWISPRKTEWSFSGLTLVVLMGLVVAVITAVSNYPGPAFDRHFMIYATANGVLYLICGAILITTIAQYSGKELIKWSCLGLSALNFIFTIYQAFSCFDKYGAGWWGAFNATGIWYTPSQMGFASALSIPFAWVIHPALSVIPISSMILSKSATPLAATLIALIATLVCSRRWVYAGLVTVLSILAVSSGHVQNRIDQRFDQRVEALAYTAKEIQDHPFIGNGFDTSLNAPMVPTESGYTYAHNDYLGLARMLGIPAMLIAIGGLIYFLCTSAPSPALFALSVAAIAMAFQTQAWFPRIMFFICIIVGLAVKEKNAVRL